MRTAEPQRPFSLVPADRRKTCFAVGFAAAWALWSISAEAGRLSISGDGAWVEEREAGLRWARCVEGMHWDGRSCAGSALLMTRDEAIALARARNAAPAAASAAAFAAKAGLWRLPRVPEMKRLAQLARRHGAAELGLDSQLFPAAPTGLHWSVSSQVDTAAVNPYNYSNIAQGRRPDNANSLSFLHGWAVDLNSGEAQGQVPKRSRLLVRFVMALP